MAAVLCRVLLDPIIGNQLFFGTLYLAVVVSAVFGGLGPAILATLFGALAADYFLIPPRFSIGLQSAEDHIGLALFIVISAALIGVAEKQRRGRERQAETLKRAQVDAVRASEERFRRLVEVSAQTVWVMSGHGEAKLDSPSWYPLARRSPEQWLGVANWLDAVHPDDRQRVMSAWQRAVQARGTYEAEFRIRNARGEYRNVTSHAAPVFDLDGSVREWVGMTVDNTEQKRTEQALTEAVQRLDAHMDNSPLAVVEFDPEFRVTRWSREAERLFGWSAGEILGRAIPELHWVHEDDTEAVQRIAQDMRDGKRPRNLSVNRNYRKDGSVVECEWYNSAIYDGEGRLKSVLSQVLDVSERKRTEERLRQTQKMESIGVLAGGVAHDFNNLLASIMGNASLATEMLPEDDPAQDLLERILKSGEHAAHLTRQMLAYSGKGQFVIEPVDLSQVVREVEDLARASVSKKVVLQSDLSPDLPAVHADRSQIHQVIMNLVINAAEAIGEESGEITVRTGLQNVTDDVVREVEEADVQPGPHVFLEVRDTGQGMDAATRAKIFDPFFTTKFTGRGLGLPAVIGIVRGHKGAIRVSTAPGKGTCVTVFLPVARPAGGAEPSRERDQVRETGTVLFVDDEEEVREMARRGLERHGYRVLLAADGREAIEVLRTAAVPVNVVVLDLSMPGMSGQEALPELMKIRPDLRVLVSSGYGKDEISRKFAGFTIAGFIRKPYTIQRLANTVRAAALAPPTPFGA